MRASWFFIAFSVATCLVLLSLGQPQLPKQSKNFSFAANPSTTWTIHYPHSFIPVKFNQAKAANIQPILLRETRGSTFGCGFYCDGISCTSFLFIIFINQFFNTYLGFFEAVVVWSANRDNLIRNGAILNFTEAGDLILKDVDGSIIWTTNTTRKSVTGMNLTDAGNLVLFDVHNSVVWQSFDHPTDSLLLGQKLVIGQKLIPSVSETSWTTQQGQYSLQFTTQGLNAYVGSNPPQLYHSLLIPSTFTNPSKERMHVTFTNGSLQLVDASVSVNPLVEILPASSTQYMKLMPDGHLKVFQWLANDWKMVNDLFQIEDCGYPLACGRNALCVADQQCSCPQSNDPSIDYFRSVDPQKPILGCSEITPLTCNATEFQEFITVEDVRYFTTHANMNMVNLETCKQACLNNCSCKAAFFRSNYSNPVIGDCYLPSELFTMIISDRKAIDLRCFSVHKSAEFKFTSFTKEKKPSCNY